LLFGAVFVLLQAGYGALRGTWVERLAIDTLTVQSAAWLIRTLTPEVAVQAVGTRLKAPGGGINIINGCEGTEVLFLLIAAFASAQLPWRARLGGLLAGTLLVFVLNQGRILALFYAYRSDKPLFDLLHGMVAPLLLIALSALFFMVWLERYGATRDSSA
jgi:exosortase/archaeosortase family protein